MTTPHDPTLGMSRTGDPSTSKAAAEQIISKKTAIQNLVLAKFLEAGPRGLTNYELEELCGDHGSTFRTRCSELVDKGLIVDSGQKRRVAGRLRIVWRLRTPEDDSGDLVDRMRGKKLDPLQALLGRSFKTEFADLADIMTYIQDNEFRLAGSENGSNVYKSLKGFRFSYDPSQNPLLGVLRYEGPSPNTTQPASNEPRLAEDANRLDV